MAITPEMFEQACGGSIQASQVTPEVLKLASSILKREAKHINALPTASWWMYETVSKIESAIPRCRDRHVQAVLTVAEQYGEDDFGTRVDAY
jgi:hypothetical protein